MVELRLIVPLLEILCSYLSTFEKTKNITSTCRKIFVNLTKKRFLACLKRVGVIRFLDNLYKNFPALCSTIKQCGKEFFKMKLFENVLRKDHSIKVLVVENCIREQVLNDHYYKNKRNCS